MKMFPVIFIACWRGVVVVEPMFAVWRYALAKRRVTAPIPETPLLEGWMTPVVVVNPDKYVF
jgi:hypothetical protein